VAAAISAQVTTAVEAAMLMNLVVWLIVLFMAIAFLD
jgi:hypothetical protein